MPSPAPPQINGRFYVYMLIDPRDGKVFWVGSGSGSRWLKSASLRPSEGSKDKHTRIAAIRSAGLRPVSRVVADFKTKVQAIEHERKLISLYDGLTNKLGGAQPVDFYYGWETGWLSCAA